MVVDCICNLCNMVSESGVVPVDWRPDVTVPLYKGKVESTECKNYSGISLISVVGKIYAEILMNRVHRRTEGLSDDEQGGFKSGRMCLDQIFTLKQTDVKE